MSFILIGFGKQTRKDLGETGYPQQCAQCGNSIIYHLIINRTFFTCFFIPIFSYRTEYRIECPVCRSSIRLQADEIKAAKQGTLNVYVTHNS
jgi:hypothetical protein